MTNGRYRTKRQKGYGCRRRNKKRGGQYGGGKKWDKFKATMMPYVNWGKKKTKKVSEYMAPKIKQAALKAVPEIQNMVLRGKGNRKQMSKAIVKNFGRDVASHLKGAAGAAGFKGL